MITQRVGIFKYIPFFVPYFKKANVCMFIDIEEKITNEIKIEQAGTT